MAETAIQRRKQQESRAVTVREAFIQESIQLEKKIARAAELAAKAEDKDEGKRFLAKYHMLCEERNWL